MPEPRAPRSARPVRATFAALAVTLAVTGCVSMPSAGPVLSYPVTQGPGAQNQPYQQTVTGPPGKDWSPAQIVEGFLTASASLGDHRHVARMYLTPEASQAWKPLWSAVVYKKGPDVREPFYPDSGKDQAVVTITGQVQANLYGSGKYAVPSASAPEGQPAFEPTFQLVKVKGGQWRISSAPPELLLTSDSFHADYQLRNLYFFDPAAKVLVPDPVYVPLQATPEDLMNGLVYDLINPPSDWLSGGATLTAFPPGTKLLSDTLDGVTAVINLGGAMTKASNLTLQRVSAQLLWTLVGSGQTGQAVQSVEVEVNGKPWAPGNSQGNPVQRQAAFTPASGASKAFYYLDDSGDVMSSTGTSSKAVKVAQIGAGFSRIAVSPDGRYLAALKNGILYTGLLGGTLARRGGAGYATMSWASNDNLWVTSGNQDNIFMLRGDATTRQQLNQRIPVSVFSSDGVNTVPGPYTALRVAPDGVRVAVIFGSTALNFGLNFGALSWQEGAKPGTATLRIVLSPFYVPRIDSPFTSLTWYGSDDVITLAQPGPYVTEYPVNGGPPTDIPAEPQMMSITASSGHALIAGLPKGRMVADASLTGSWMPAASGISPIYPG